MSLKGDDLYFSKILERVKSERNLDFTGYRDAILKRRVMFRVKVTKRDNFEQYHAFLKFHPDEMDKLMDSLTINVTEFFRDSQVFDLLEKKVVPDIIKKKSLAGFKSINVWSCACSSGEEPFSLLMIFSECLKSRLNEFKLRIYATDIDPASLAKAKEGVYEVTQFKNLSNERKLLISKYFYDMGNGRYWIREEWPPYIEFKYHDVTADIPFDNIDMILCRNMLIYFDRELQEQVFERFYGSLNEGGYLVLGNVESISPSVRDKFEEFDRNARIYRKK